MGGVCDALPTTGTGNKSNLRASVYELNGATFTQIFDFPLTYPKGYPAAANVNITGWFPWTDNFDDLTEGTGTTLRYPVPIFTDIEFDVDGSMVLGFGDRTGWQGGDRNYRPDGTSTTLYEVNSQAGDILRAYSANGTFVLENNAKAGPNVGYGANNQQGPGFGEFYNDNWIQENGTVLYHAEEVIGGLALKPGSGDVVVTAIDPEDKHPYAGGVRYMDNTTGLVQGFYTVYITRGPDGSPNPGTFAKATGLGDIELSCDNLEILEIGNRVWLDTDKDGVQDACEKGLKDVNVTLYKGTTKIATTKTDANGEYYFSKKSKIIAGTWSGTGVDTPIRPTTSYSLVCGTGGQITSSSDTLKVAGIGKFLLTQKDATANTGNDLNDSDAAKTNFATEGGSFPVIPVTTGTIASTDHTYDVGFYCIDPYNYKVAVTQATCTGITANSNAKVEFTAVKCADKYAFSKNSGGKFTGAVYASATAIIGTAFALNNLANPATAKGDTFCVRLYNGLCCFKDTAIVLPFKDCSCIKPVITATPAQALCQGQPAGAFTMNVTTGTVSTQKWYGPIANTLPATPLGTAIAGATLVTFTPTAAQLPAADGVTRYYAVVGQNSPAVCSDTAYVAISVKAKPNAGTDQVVCAGKSATLTGTSPTTGTWTAQASPANPVGATLSATSGGVATVSFASSSSGIFNFVYTANGGCTDTVQVSVTAKPNAGADQTLACANAGTNTLTTSTTLVPSPTGGTWAQIGTTPASASITGNAVSAMTVAGTYSFVYTLNGCKDTVAVTVQPCAGCVKPNAGLDAATICQPTSTAKLTAVTAGGTWAPIGSPANPSAATINASGNISGLTAAGTYKFVYSVTGGGIICTDTAQVMVNAKPVITDGTATICAGETVDLTSQITGYAALLSPAWTVATAGGTAVTTPTAVKPTTTTTFVLVAQNANGCKDTANVVVTVNPKPNAGTDQTLACANAGSNTLTTSTTLVPTPAGGVYTQIGTTPASASITGNNVTGMSVAGTYQFVYTTTAGCKDTVAVTVSPCAGCVKPDAGMDQTQICTAGVAPSTATLTASPAGGSWAAQSGNPVAATVTSIGAVSGMTTPGTYKFIYSVTGGGQTCRDTVAVIVPNCNCNPPLPMLITPSLTACIGDTFPTIKATVVGLATVEWFATATSTTVLFTGLNYKPLGTVTSAGATFYAQARSTDPTCPTAISTSRVMATINAQICTKIVDLALKKYINKKIAQIGDELIYTIKVFNQSNTAATGAEVTDSIATSVQFVAASFVASRGSAVITGNVIKWTIGGIAANAGANGDTVTLSYKVKATQQGVHYNTAEISKTNEKDIDSTPSNGKDGEDDIDRQCFTVPFQLCPGEKVQVNVPIKYTNVQWFKDGSSTAVGTGNEILLSDVGTYTFTARNNACPAGGCCPVIIEPGANCCPVDLCIPFTIQKTKKK